MINKPKGNSNKLFHFSPGILVLENKTVFRGIGIGYQSTATGEVCFNTSITGCQEIISDPSYAGQIINFTFPHIGNVGTNNEDNESDKIWTRGVIFNSGITNPSNYRSLKNLDGWLKKHKIVGITGLDTRSLTNLIRDKGAPKGTICNNRKGNFNLKKLIKSNKLILIAGGSHPTGAPKDTIKMGFDYVIVGEGEITLQKIISKLKENEELNEKIIIGEQVINLDEFEKIKPLTPVEITRGCPYKCRFCQTPQIFGNNVRHRSIESILKLTNPNTDTRVISPNAFCYGSKTGTKPNIEKLKKLLKKQVVLKSINLKLHTNT